MTITDFLGARISEDEAAAREAATWTARGPSPEVKWIGEPGDHLVTRLGVAGPHIARHDPARVLAECAAKRAIIGLHAAFGRSSEPGAAGAWSALGVALQDLAAVYASHPDYREEWSVA